MSKKSKHKEMKNQNSSWNSDFMNVFWPIF